MSEHSAERVATALVAPFSAGCCAQILLYGISISSYWNFIFSPAGRSASLLHKVAFWLVLAFTAGYTALCVHDVINYSTMISRDAVTIAKGSVTQCVEPVLAALIGGLVQTVLVLRAVKVVQTSWIRWAMLVVFGLIITVEILSGVLVTADAFYFQKGVYVTNFPISFADALSMWMWSASSADVSITATYIFLIYRRLKNGDDTTKSVLQLIARSAIESASYTAVFAVISAATSQRLSRTNVMVYAIPYAFWLPLPSLYALSLVNTLSIGHRVAAQMHAGADHITLEVTRGTMIETPNARAPSKERKVPTPEQSLLQERRGTVDSLYPV